MVTTGFWVFGYGSLIWDPGFPVAEKHIARLEGFHRSFCMRSIHHRGTEDKPGLVLALDKSPGGYCNGVAFRVADEHAAKTLQDLRERELVSSAYLEAELPIQLQDGRDVMSVTYIVDRDHVQYCGDLPLSEQAQIISTAVGGRGPNTEYLFNTADHLVELGLEDPDLSWLSERVRGLIA